MHQRRTEPKQSLRRWTSLSVVGLLVTAALGFLAPSEAGAATGFFVVVDQTTQHAKVFTDAGEYIRLIPVSSGRGGATPNGNFAIYSKSRWTTSSSSGNIRMPFMSRIVGGIGFHGIPLKGGVPMPTPLGREPVSAGCIRMADADAEWIFNTLPIGTPVQVVGRWAGPVAPPEPPPPPPPPRPAPLAVNPQPPYWSGWPVARNMTADPASGGGVTVDAFGGLHAWGGAWLDSSDAPYWAKWDVARDVARDPATHGGVTLDAFGGLHAWGGAVLDRSGAPYWNQWDIARAVALNPSGSGGWVMDGFGGLHAFGGAPAITGAPYWKNWDIARDLVKNPSGPGGWTMDAWGGTHAWGGAPPLGGTAPYWPKTNHARALVISQPAWGGSAAYTLDAWGGVHAWAAPPLVPPAASGPARPAALAVNPQPPDWYGWPVVRNMAADPASGGGVTLDVFGGLHVWGGAVLNKTGAPYWQGWDIARDVVRDPATQGGVTLDGFGGLHVWGGAALDRSGAPYWNQWDIARAVALNPSGSGGWVLDGFGGVHAFGGAPDIAGAPYWNRWDIARDLVKNPSGPGGWTLDAWGTAHAWGGAPVLSGTPPRWPGTNNARALVISKPAWGGPSAYTVDAWGGVHPW
ncbi:MAG: L,D-transpeptidase family protein [Acidimicrobiia bacterium]|nr:L,D-transpeptidase family protein [Acidimicrobiia bacterium]